MINTKAIVSISHRNEFKTSKIKRNELEKPQKFFLNCKITLMNNSYNNSNKNRKKNTKQMSSGIITNVYDC